VAERVGVGVAAISTATRDRLAAVLEPGLPPTNPLDAWGTGNDADQIFAACITALLDDPATGALALNLDLTTEPTPATSYTGLAVTAAASTTKPVAALANLSSAVDVEEAATLRAAGVPVLEGTATGLAAFGICSPTVSSWPGRSQGRWMGRDRWMGRGLWTAGRAQLPSRLGSPIGGLAAGPPRWRLPGIGGGLG
jgi:hypothetical protein